mmetsp:Transcript_25114/g.54339  ORF Transcript_25114/g.54339 Transcript_25114/m.54339 type:complete len:223 (-) Transcript_25114:725-1393(-)
MPHVSATPCISCGGGGLPRSLLAGIPPLAPAPNIPHPSPHRIKSRPGGWVFHVSPGGRGGYYCQKGGHREPLGEGPAAAHHRLKPSLGVRVRVWVGGQLQTALLCLRLPPVAPGAPAHSRLGPRYAAAGRPRLPLLLQRRHHGHLDCDLHAPLCVQPAAGSVRVHHILLLRGPGPPHMRQPPGTPGAKAAAAASRGPERPRHRGAAGLRQAQARTGAGGVSG